MLFGRLFLKRNASTCLFKKNGDISFSQNVFSHACNKILISIYQHRKSRQMYKWIMHFLHMKTAADIFNPFSPADAFWRNSSRRLLKTLWPKVKLLIMSNFSFGHIVSSIFLIIKHSFFWDISRFCQYAFKVVCCRSRQTRKFFFPISIMQLSLISALNDLTVNAPLHNIHSSY